MSIDPAIAYRDYPLRTLAQTRSEDVNAAGHVSAIALAVILENDRTKLLVEEFGYGGEDRDGGCALIHIEANFSKEVHHPAILEVRSGIAAIGKSSFKFAQALFQENECVCLAMTTYVNVDGAGSAPIGEKRREAMTAYLLAQG